MILVTGGGGYLGNVLCRMLLARKYPVRCMDNFHKGHCDALLGIINNPLFNFQYGDITNYDDCWKAVQGCNVIIHLAGIVGFPACKRQPALSQIVNVEGTKNIIKARNQYNPYIPMVNSSTGSVYGKIEGMCIEDSPPNPQSEYGKQKLEAEQLMAQEQFTVSLRFATCFGLSPCMRANLLINNLVYDAIYHKCLTIFEPDARRTFVHIRDLCESFILMYNKLSAGALRYKIYNCGNHKLNWTKRQVAEYIKEKTGCIVNYQDFDKDLDQRDYEVSYDRIRQVPDFTCYYDMEHGIDELIKATSLLRVRNPYD